MRYRKIDRVDAVLAASLGEAVTLLEAFLDDPDPMVRIAAVDAIVNASIALELLALARRLRSLDAAG